MCSVPRRDASFETHLTPRRGDLLHGLIHAFGATSDDGNAISGLGEDASIISSDSWTPWYTVHTHAEDAPVPAPEAQIDQYQTNMNCTRRRTISNTDDDCNRAGSGRRHEDRCCFWCWKERNGGLYADRLVRG
jgi:hypothetical protein